MKKEKANNFGYKLLRPIFFFIMWIWYHPKHYGKENIPKKGPTILAGNHTHNYDHFIMGMGTRRAVHFLAKKELHDGKFGWLFKFLGTVPVDRKTKDEKAKEESIRLLKLGEVYAIYPEGTINRKKEELLLPFKYGAVSFASKTDAQIVPFAIYGEYKFHSKDLSVIYGKPFKVGDMNLEEANNLLRKKVTDLYYKLEKINKK